MSEIQTFNLPDLGEGLTDGEILRWLVAPGDRIKLNQPIVEVETAKAAVEIPSPYAGVVTKLHHPEGAIVAVGSPIIAIDVAASEGITPKAPIEPTLTPAAGRTPVLVGYGPRTDTARRRPRRLADAGVGSASSGAPREPEIGGAGLVGDPAEPEHDETLSLLPTIPDALAAGVKPVRHGGLEMGRAAERNAQAAPPVPPLLGAGLLPGAGATGAHGAGATGAHGAGATGAHGAGATGAHGAGATGAHGAGATGAHGAGATGAHGAGATGAYGAASAARARAKPPVRKLARDLGVDLTTIPATGPHGSVSRSDVHRAAELIAEETPAGSSAVLSASVATEHTAATANGTVGTAGRERRIPVRGVRKLTAAAMVTSVATAPHVTEFLTVDVTRTLKAVRTLRDDPAFADVRVGPLLLIAKAALQAIKRHPELNSSWISGADGDEIVIKEYVNLGIAAATPRGLLVPNIKDADQLPLPALAAALDQLVSAAKAGKTSPAELAGGTITITNVGVFGVDTGTPIINPGEAAILCVGQISERPWVHKGEVKARSLCQLALSFDHRIVDGEGGSKFLADLGRYLTDPAATSLAWS